MNKRFLIVLLFTGALFAHPMGNFSVSHYAKFQVGQQAVTLDYVLDLAEIPTFELLRTWELERSSPQAQLERRAEIQARLWLKNLTVTLNGKVVTPQFESSHLAIADGAGNLPILRITTRARIAAAGGKLNYSDANYPDRAGWKEIVIANGIGAALRNVSQSSQDVSHGLTQYPSDPTLAPPQDLRAEMEWTVTPIVTAAIVSKPVVHQIEQPKANRPAPSPTTVTTQNAPPGAVARGDFLSRVLHERSLSLWMICLALGVSFGLGAAHALTPGHGKTIVAAYLVGSRGTLKHAIFLGMMVTFTHTIVVFALGFATLFLFRYIAPERVSEILSLISALTIVALGAWMLRSRIRQFLHARAHALGQAHDHAHNHSHDHGHDHHHAHDGHHHHHHGHDHSHDHSHGHSHSHMPDEISWRGLAALGASGGLVPCESALLLLLGAISIGRAGLGLLLLLAFSLGLAVMLTAIGGAVLYAKHLIPSKAFASRPFRWLAIASPAFVLLLGVMMTVVSLRNTN